MKNKEKYQKLVIIFLLVMTLASGFCSAVLIIEQHVIAAVIFLTIGAITLFTLGYRCAILEKELEANDELRASLKSNASHQFNNAFHYSTCEKEEELITTLRKKVKESISSVMDDYLGL